MIPTNISIINSKALSEVHPAIFSPLHEDYFIRSALGSKCFTFTVLCQICKDLSNRDTPTSCISIAINYAQINPFNAGLFDISKPLIGENGLISITLYHDIIYKTSNFTDFLQNSQYCKG